VVAMPPVEANQARRQFRLLAGEGFRMAVLSLASLGLGYALTLTMTEAAGLDPKIAYASALVACSILNFFGCRHFVFRGARAPLWREAAKFFPSVLAFRGAEVALFSLMLAFHPNYHVAYFATAAIALVAKLLVSKFFIFRRPVL